ncbi:MAG: N-acetylmuramoyl-L-alanine amidase [Labilithrix sp.]|jgi:hypothetical protein|nr:N-acetylmuramoyl-L-alanine amidase [Labilithrix sp.]
MARAARLVVASLAFGLPLVACADAAHDEGDGRANVAHVAQALGDGDPVSAAVDTSCTTTSVKGLSTQLVAEIQCMRPGSMKSIEGAAGLSLGSAVFPYLQTPAADALLVAQKARGTTMTINSALRTLPQQYLLYRWYKLGRCGISLAAEPGKSNHETAVAVDLADAQAWRPAMTDAGFKWLGTSDPVHFDFVASGAIDLRGLSVTAFQRLWNRNHPEDPISEDGDYGTETETRVARAPVGGFARGAEGCPTGDAAAPAAPAPAAPATTQPVPDAPEPESDDGGCSVSARSVRRSTSSSSFAITIAISGLVVLAASARRRRRR